MNTTTPHADGLDEPLDRTVERIVPVTVPRSVEAHARDRADWLDEALEDAVADHVTVIPDYCISTAEGRTVSAGPVRRVALHTAVEPELASLVNALAENRRDWLRDAVAEKVRRERGGRGRDGPTSQSR